MFLRSKLLSTFQIVVRNRTIAILSMGLLLILVAGCTTLVQRSRQKATGISDNTPSPKRYVADGSMIFDVNKKEPLFFKGIGYSPYLPNETPLHGDPPGNDDRYEEHLGLMKDMAVNYLHVFPMKMPSRFFAALDKTDMRYGQRHLYCHTSWTHIGPIADRPDLELPKKNIINPDLGDLVCLNIYTYARGVVTSQPGSFTHKPYQGYLEELTAQTDKPIFISQVGLSTSPFEAKPWVPGFGGYRVEDVPDAFTSIWKDIRTAKGSEKICGVSFFELNDEWWKSGEDPADSKRHERQDPEECFGLFAIGPDHRLVPKGKIPETIKTLFRTP